MHPSFGIEYQCSSTKWEDVMKGPSREAVLAYTYKVLHYRELFGTPGATAQGEDNRRRLEGTAPAPEQVTERYAAAA
jgi:hypothetical protein